MAGTISERIVYREATLADIESMTTIISRSFAPDALPQIMPDTPIMRDWWSRTYQQAMQDPAARLLLAVAKDNEVTGVLTMHKSEASQAGARPNNAGILAAIPLTPDHGSILASALATLKQEREELMGDQCNFLIELLGVDCAFQDLGIGRRLIQSACEIADQQDAAIYLRTTAAANYYTRKLDLGFTKIEQAGGPNASAIVRPRASKR